MLVLFATSSVYGDDYFKGIVCEQDISTVKNLTPVYMNTLMTVTWYEKDDDHIAIGSVESERVNYLFWENKFYGKVIAIYGAENITEVLRFFQTKYGHSITIDKKRMTIWLTDDHVFRVTRFSFHLGLVEVLCREMFFKLEMPDDQTNTSTN